MDVRLKPRIIFLDIDGPVINTPCFYIDSMCSMERTVMSTTAIGYLNRLCDAVGAKIVTNTTHNTHIIEDKLSAEPRDIRKDLITWGLKAKFFHENSYTEYPFPKNGKMSEHRRLTAVNNWLAENGDHEWYAFDDDYFHSTNQYVIDYEKGIDYDAFVAALSHFGEDPRVWSRK